MGSTFLMVGFGEAGMALPMLGIVQAVTRRGHRALVLVSAKYRDGVVAAGGEPLVPQRFEDPFEAMMRRLAEPRCRRLGDPLGVRQASQRILRRSLGIASEVEELIHRERVDCVVGSFTSLGARYAAERTGRAFATLGQNPLVLLDERGGFVLPPRPWMRHLPPRAFHTLLNRLLPLHQCRAALGLPPHDGNLAEVVHGAMSESLHLVTTHASFFPAGACPRAGTLCVGPLSFSLPRGGARPFPVESLAPGTVLVSTTTSSMDGGLLRRALGGVAALGVPVLATAASASDVPTGLGEHVRIESFVPHDEVLPHVSALVTHGGWGVVGRALRHGVPMLVISVFGDQPVIGARLAELGLAYHLPLKKASSEAIRDALSTLREDRALHARVKATAEELAHIDSQALVANALERLVAGRA